MKRRVKVVFLIAVLLCGYPLPPARASSALEVCVQIGEIAPHRTAEVCSQIESALNGVSARAWVVGQCVYAELSAVSARQLAGALSQLAQAAEGAGLRFRIIPGRGQQLRAVAAKALTVRPSAGRRGEPAAVLHVPTRAQRPALTNRPDGAELPAIQSAPVGSARAARAPPA